MRSLSVRVANPIPDKKATDNTENTDQKKQKHFQSVYEIRVYLWLNLSVVAYRLNRATTHRFIAERFLFVSLRLLVNEGIVVFVAAHEIVGRGVATDIAIDARGVHVKRTADVLFHFVVLIRHARDESSLRESPSRQTDRRSNNRARWLIHAS